MVFLISRSVRLLDQRLKFQLVVFVRIACFAFIGCVDGHGGSTENWFIRVRTGEDSISLTMQGGPRALNITPALQ